MEQYINNIKTEARYFLADEYGERFEKSWNLVRESFMKFEALQEYNVSSDKNYSEFVAGDLQKYIKGLKEFYQEESQSCIGKEEVKMMRLRVVQEPISQYLKYEFYSYLISEKTGEDIRCINTDELNADLTDFIIFDEKEIYILDFDNNNSLRGAWYSENAAEINKLVSKYLEYFSRSKDFKACLPCDNHITELMKEEHIINR